MQYRCKSYTLSKSLKSSLICALVFCTLIAGSEANAENFLSRWDQTLFDRIYDAPPHREPMWTLMEGITEFGHYRAVMGLSVLLMAYGDEAHQETGRLLSSAFLGTGLVTFGMKRLIGRKRPLDESLGNPAFPSGHTSLGVQFSNDFRVSVSEITDSALHRCGTRRVLAYLSRTALHIRCDSRGSNWHGDRHAGLASARHVAEMGILPCGIFWTFDNKTHAT